MRRRWLARVVGAFAFSLASLASARPGIQTTDTLPPAARRIVRARMKGHAHNMERLVWDVMLLDYDSADEDAVALARDALPLDRDESSVEHLVAFFAMQDRLRSAAHDLSDAAARKDGAALATSFKALSETCIRCHVSYLEPNTRYWHPGDP